MSDKELVAVSFRGMPSEDFFYREIRFHPANIPNVGDRIHYTTEDLNEAVFEVRTKTFELSHHSREDGKTSIELEYILP